MASIMLRAIDTNLWAQFSTKAKSEGTGPKQKLLQLMAAYIRPAAAPGAAAANVKLVNCLRSIQAAVAEQQPDGSRIAALAQEAIDILSGS
jgi:hypothetical protein